MSANRSTASLALLTAALSAVWMLWSGIYKPLVLGLGALSIGLVLWFVRRADLLERDILPLRLWLRLPRFWLWLLREVMVSSFKVARLVLDPRVSMDLTTVEIEAIPRSRLGQATLGNCITLTPGTVTLDVHEGRVQVHALTREDAEAVQAGDMNRRVAECLER